MKIRILLRRAWNTIKSDPRILSVSSLFIVSGMCVCMVILYMGMNDFSFSVLSALGNISAPSATTVLTLAASVIAVIVFTKGIPAWSQSITKSGSGTRLPPCRQAGSEDLYPSKSGISFKVHRIARRFILESVTLSIQTNDPEIASSIVMVIESKDKKLYEGGISIGNDLLSGDDSIGKNGFYSVTRQIDCGFTGDLSYSIFNHTNETLMCYTILRARTIHSLGDLILEKYFPSISLPVIGIIHILGRILSFQPDYWVRRVWAKMAKK
jgi:hypothetical protein